MQHLLGKKKKIEISKPGPIIKLSTDYDRKVKVAKKIKNKYLRKRIGQKTVRIMHQKIS